MGRRSRHDSRHAEDQAAQRAKKRGRGSKATQAYHVEMDARELVENIRRRMKAEGTVLDTVDDSEAHSVVAADDSTPNVETGCESRPGRGRTSDQGIMSPLL